MEAPIDTQKEIAKAAGVSHDTIAKAKFLPLTCTPAGTESDTVSHIEGATPNGRPRRLLARRR